MLTYEQFRTGLTFGEVRSWLWSPSPDPRDWPRVTRHTVLGRWRQHKRELYDRYLAEQFAEIRKGPRGVGSVRGEGSSEVEKVSLG